MQRNYNSEVEDLINPKDELRKKIVNLAGTIRNWNEETTKVRKSVKDQLKVISDLGLKKYKMQKAELRKLTEEIFWYHGISESWLRKLLPVELKDTSKTRISYLQRQEMEKERQRLLQLQQQAAESRQEAEATESSNLDGHTMGPASYQPKLELTAIPEIKQEFETGYAPADQFLDCSAVSLPSEESIIIQKEQISTSNNIKKLQEDVLWLSKPFVAKAYLQVTDQDIPLVAEIDPVKKSILSIQVAKDY